MLDFPAPVIISNAIVFRPTWANSGLICVDKNTGNKLWETSTPLSAQTWCALGNKTLVTGSAKFFSCDPTSGAMREMGPAFDVLQVETIGDSDVAVVCGSGPERGMTLRNPRTWKPKWTRPDVWRLLRLDRHAALVLLGSEGWTASENVWINPHPTPRRTDLALLSMVDGKSLWSIETRAAFTQATTLLLSNVALLSAGPNLLSIARADGRVTRRRFANGDQPMPIWEHNGLPYVLIDRVVYSINPRDLTLSRQFSEPEADVHSITQVDDTLLLESTREVFAFDIKAANLKFVTDHSTPSDHRRWIRSNDGKLYFSSTSTELTEFDTHSGEKRAFKQGTWTKVSDDPNRRPINPAAWCGTGSYQSSLFSWWLFLNRATNQTAESQPPK